MNQPLHLLLLLPTLTLAATKTTTTTAAKPSPCPSGFTGRTSTAGCTGYVDCQNGSLVASYPCTAGTLYDIKAGICNWPSAVTCDAVEEEFDDDDDYVDDDGVDGTTVSTTKFCPADYTGKAPTTDCLGYVICTSGEEGLSSKCPNDSFFNSMTYRCEYGFTDCQLLVSPSENNLAKYKDLCPEGYSGKAPTKDCGGYVKCLDGKVSEVLTCPVGTMFDVMKLACTYAQVDCGSVDDKEEDEEDPPEEDDASKYCPDDYSGRAPTKNCNGYVDCRNGKVKLIKDCPVGTKFDVMILSCTFSEVQCEANVAVTYSPTPSPEEGGKLDKEDRPDRIIVEDTCPDGYTGNKAINGCTGYIYCAAGTQLGKFPCTAGTLFDVSLGYCNWASNVNIDRPECSTSSPSYTPTMSPMSPTASPSYTPTILDVDGVVYYPDYKNGICKDDGKYPPSLNHIYLRISAHGCCSAFFDSTYDRCMQAFASEAPSMAPSGEMIWYPDYDYNLCRSDLEYSKYEVNFFSSYERCCEFDFLDQAECMLKKPSALGLIYYPHYPSGTCKNDGRQGSSEIWLYTSMKDCCKNDQVQPFSSCMNGGDGDMQENSAGVTTTTTTPAASKDYYPDYSNDICRNDDNAPEFEVNFFSTYESCCQFTWMDTPKCMANKPIPPIPDSEKWYPIAEKGYCLNNGNPPDKVVLSDTSKDCCKRFFASSQRKCVDQSTKRWYPDYDKAHCKNDGNEPQGIFMSETYEMCCDRFMSSIKPKCYSSSNAFTNAPPPTTSPSKKPVAAKTYKPTTSPTQKPNQSNHCALLSTKKKCNDDSSCEWSDATACTLKPVQTRAPVTSKLTSKPTGSPTSHPSLRPSNQSITNGSVCQPLINKKQCSQNSSCKWDEISDDCIPLPGPDETSCQSYKNKRQCNQDDFCGWNETFDICMKVTMQEITTTTTSSTTTATKTESPTKKPSQKPTRKPRPEPTPKPTHSPTQRPTDAPIQQSLSCDSFTTTKKCEQNSWCQWNDSSRKCVSLSAVQETVSPTVFPTFSPTNTPTNNDDGLTEMWFPIIAQSRCVLLPSSSPGNDPYSTYVECCNNPWINDREACMDDAKTQLDPSPPSPNIYKFYPDYFIGSCKNDGKEPASETNLYDTLDECCNNEWLDYTRCKQISSNESPPSKEPNINKYYPDYFFNVCRNDGNQPPTETYLFDNVEDCCGLEYMEYEGCVYLSN